MLGGIVAAPLAWVGSSRFISRDEQIEAEERVARRLQRIIFDLGPPEADTAPSGRRRKHKW